MWYEFKTVKYLLASWESSVVYNSVLIDSSCESTCKYFQEQEGAMWHLLQILLKTVFI